MNRTIHPQFQLFPFPGKENPRSFQERKQEVHSRLIEEQNSPLKFPLPPHIFFSISHSRLTLILPLLPFFIHFFIAFISCCFHLDFFSLNFPGAISLLGISSVWYFSFFRSPAGGGKGGNGSGQRRGYPNLRFKVGLYCVCCGRGGFVPMRWEFTDERGKWKGRGDGRVESRRGYFSPTSQLLNSLFRIFYFVYFISFPLFPNPIPPNPAPRIYPPHNLPLRWPALSRAVVY